MILLGAIPHDVPLLGTLKVALFLVEFLLLLLRVGRRLAHCRACPHGVRVVL